MTEKAAGTPEWVREFICEGCGGTITANSSNFWPEGWTEIGISRIRRSLWGKRVAAQWCSECSKSNPLPSGAAPTLGTCRDDDNPHELNAYRCAPCREWKPVGAAPGTREETPDWGRVHELLTPWREVWKGDRTKLTAEYSAWILDAAGELFAHDMCDAWAWNDYVHAAAVIIERHFKPQAVHLSEAQADLTYWKRNALALTTLLKASTPDTQWPGIEKAFGELLDKLKADSAEAQAEVERLKGELARVYKKSCDVYADECAAVARAERSEASEKEALVQAERLREERRRNEILWSDAGKLIADLRASKKAMREALAVAAIESWDIKNGLMAARDSCELLPDKETWLAGKVAQWMAAAQANQKEPTATWLL